MNRWSSFSLLWLLIFAVVAEETPPGLVATDTEQDLIAEASQTGAQAQKRDAGLSNSYGEPLPPDAYGPPQNIPVVVQELQPAPVYGVPDFNLFQDPPPGAYGPPSPVIFLDQNYAGPPPPLGKPKPHYGPPKFHSPKQQYGPPKPVYGPPKKTYGPPKQSFPKFHGIPLKPPKISFSKPGFGGPKPVYGAPKPVYGPPKITYGTPLNVQSIPLQNIPLSPPPQTFGSSTNFGHIGIGHGDIGIGTIGTQFGSLEASVGTSIGTNDLNFNLPAPIYGTPLPNLPLDLKPNFPIPADTYGPPGHSLGPIGPNDQIVIQNFDNIGHYGPPQPDPNPQPPHPGIPAPPTPPHVLYDGWKPIPGVSKPNFDNFNINTLHSIESLAQTGGNIENLDQYGPPPQIQEVINVEGQSLPNINQNVHFLGPQVNTGYSSVHQDALANIDLNAIVGGDSNHIDQSKTIYEAHYTDNGQNQDLSLIQAVPEKPVEVYSLPSAEGASNGHYPLSFRQQGAKGLNPPSGVYGVPPGSQYGAPPKPLPSNLPIPYGTYSGGGHTGGPPPRHPVKFRESVPEGLIQQIGHVSHHKDAHGVDEISQHPAYLPPPIRDVKDINQQTGNHGYSVQIEPSSLYSLPHSGNPISFQVQQQPSNLYGSPIDSYAAPLLTVADHTSSGSSKNEIAATIDGTILGNLSNLDAAAILKHCPYHEAILKAAQRGEKIPSDLASKYVASLSSLGSTLQKNQQSSAATVVFGTPVSGRYSGSYSTKDQDTGSQTIVETVLPNHIESDKSKVQKGQVLKDSYKHNIQQVSEQIHQTSEKIKAISETTKNLQQKIESGNKIISQNGQYQFGQEIPVKGNLASYSIQIQSANSDGKSNSPSVPHNQLLSEDLLQSILQAIEQPRTNQAPNKEEIHQTQSKLNNQQYVISDSNPNNDQSFGIPNADQEGLVLPEGYEPVDRSTSKDNKQQKDQETQSSNTSIKQLLQGEAKNKHKELTDCDLRPDNSITHTIVVPAPGIETVQRVDEVEDNEIAIFFGEDSKDDKDEKAQETVTEISVATSISENLDNKEKKPEFGEKIKKDS